MEVHFSNSSLDLAKLLLEKEEVEKKLGELEKKKRGRKKREDRR